MPNLVTVLNAEIARLARKEIKKANTAIEEDIKKLKSLISTQKKQIAALEKQLGVVAKTAQVPKPKADAEAESSAPQKKTRISGGLIKKLRKRLGISQGDLALLLDVSGPAVSSWEQGRSLPRPAKREILVALRQCTPSEAQQRLAEKKGK